VADKKKTAKRAPKKTVAITNPETGEVLVRKTYEEYPEAFRYLAKMMYITGQAAPSEIANKLNIPINTIQSWQSRDKWTFLKRQVQRLANRDAVKAARRSMSVYVTDIDRGLNTLLTKLTDRLDNVTEADKITKEGDIVKYLLDIWRIKLQLVRTLTYGVQGQAFTPHPENMRFDGTTVDPTKGPLFSKNAVDGIIQGIPAYMQEAAKYVLGMSVEDFNEDVIDAVAIYLDELEKHEVTDGGIGWLEEDEEEE
jgi:hypothetical protein